MQAPADRDRRSPCTAEHHHRPCTHASALMYQGDEEGWLCPSCWTSTRQVKADGRRFRLPGRSPRRRSGSSGRPSSRASPGVRMLAGGRVVVVGLPRDWSPTEGIAHEDPEAGPLVGRRAGRSVGLRHGPDRPAVALPLNASRTLSAVVTSSWPIEASRSSATGRSPRSRSQRGHPPRPVSTPSRHARVIEAASRDARSSSKGGTAHDGVADPVAESTTRISPRTYSLKKSSP